ncbi:putative disease resistance RPP13-like protein 1 [Trifolium pratense]|uniref:putative disease resistance RPP13-like protein 1 n=1 Tax=Trifolium pratense TaxID=57577 RepID=UPI001E695794|nr:putative disease resistance RPP13-like protein 1 [Trifolium pratense]
MAATLVGGAFLSASVQTIMDKLTSSEFRDFVNNKKLNMSLLKQLETTLLTLHAVLDDAENKQINNRAVKQWLDELKDAIFDAEDLLNQISYDSLRCKVENSITKSENINGQVWNFLSSPFQNLYREINSQMKNMSERLQLFAQQKDILGLQTVGGRVFFRTPSSSIVDQSFMVGRKNDKEKLVNMLLSGGDNIGVVPIFGMGGVGKTTLAQILYNDKEVQGHFDVKAWVCVSEEFDVLRVCRTLLESITSSVWESDNLDSLRVKLKQNLKDKRFLFVLDDMWNDSYSDWHELVTPFIDGKSGSRVIITTRQQKVAEVTHTFPIHKLEPLSYEDCWSLLSKHAFRSEDFGSRKYPSLETICRKIAKKCCGLPIAAKTLGGLLRSKVDAKEWSKILNSDIWNFPNDNVLPALLLSYQYLPSHLKRCFAYCSIFPKDYFLDRKQMVLLWMAEGFLEHSQGRKTMEEVGDDYFVELSSRSLIQQSNDDSGGQKFFMHDLVNDLATIVSGKSCCRGEHGGNISVNVRHLSYNQEEYDIFKKFENFYDFKCLRSFLPLGLWWRQSYLSKKVVDDLIPTLRRLRVLSLSGYRNITILPDSIGSLGQLRYLDLSNTRIESLPDTTCNLCNLQTLILSYCYHLVELPVHIGKLINLRHLNISWTNIKEMPMEILELENLQTLTTFVVGNQKDGLSVRELGKFPNLQGKLCIQKLHNVIDVVEAYGANLKSKEHIEELILRWGDLTEDSQTARAVLDALQPSTNLKKLSIDLYGGTSIPSWLGDSSFSNMVTLFISNCIYCTAIPPLGQLPSLKDLTIRGMTLETIGAEFYGMLGGGSSSSFQPFPSLEILKFQNMSNWKEWLPFLSNKFPFPCLKCLRLFQCPKLRGYLPSHLFSIEQIGIYGCDLLLATPPTLHWISSIKIITVEGDLDSQADIIQWPMLETDSPCQLQRASVRCCDTLMSLPKMILSSTCLQHLELYNLPYLTAFPADCLLTSLQLLRIIDCENLTFLPPTMWCKYMSLMTLELENSCNALTSFPLDGFPVLQSLSIDGCMSLESIFISNSSSLTTLECLTLIDLPKLKLSFGEGACLLPKLRSFQIKSVRVTTPVVKWGLQLLTALSDLHIGGDDIVNTLLKEKLLPISLVSLTITNLTEMKSLKENAFQHLSSLESLHFLHCPGLESLPEDTLLSSLKLLSIRKCSRLEARYESQRGKDWSNIAHIPVIKINGQVII